MAEPLIPDYEALETPRPERPENTKTDAGAVHALIADYPRIILFGVGVVLLLHFFQVVARELLLFVFALLFAIVLNAPVRLLEKRGVKRGLSVAGVAVILLAAIGSSIYVIGPRLAAEAVSFARDAPERTRRLHEQIVAQTTTYPAVAHFLKSQGSSLDSHALSARAEALLPGLGKAAIELVGMLAEGFVVLVVTLYLVASPKPIVKGFIAAVSPQHRKSATHALTRIVGQLEAWALSTLMMMAVVGIAAGVGLAFLHVKNAFLFGVLAGFLEAVPTVGPIVSAVPPFLVALADEPQRAGFVLLLFLAVQQTESHILVPWIMSKNLNLHPVSILFFVVALGSTLGIAGALLAVPTAIVVKIVYQEFYLKTRAPHESDLDAAAEQVLRVGAPREHEKPAPPIPPPAIMPALAPQPSAPEADAPIDSVMPEPKG